jgi:outer membrane protein TolC
MIKILLLILPLAIYAESLKSLLNFATQHSDLVVSKTFTQKAKKSELEARKSAYYPTLDMGAFYQTLEERTPMQAGDVYSGYAKLALDIYDGGKKSSLLSQSENNYKSSSFDLDDTRKSLSLKIVQGFFGIKSLEATLEARNKAKKSLQEQLTRMQRFYIARVATQDDVDRLQAAYDANVYEMQALKFQILTLMKTLELNVGKEILTLNDSKFQNFKDSDIELTDSIKSLVAQKDALVSGAESIDSVYYPQVRVEDTYSIYGYNRSDILHPEGVDNQNKLLLTLNLRLFDNGTLSKTKEAILSNSQALNTQVAYATKEQKMQYDLAISRIKTNSIKIKSAKSALVSASSAFKTISKKYDAGIVDNVVYLDALSSQTSAKALYETSLNDLEVAYAFYYFYAGKNIEEFLQ